MLSYLKTLRENYDAINHYISHKISDINKESTEIV